MIWTEADREAFVRQGPRLWEAVPATKPSNVFRYMIGGDIWRLNNGPYEANLLRDAGDDDLAAAFGLAVASLPEHGMRIWREYGVKGDPVWCISNRPNYHPDLSPHGGVSSFGLLVAAYRALYAVHGLEWEEVGDA